MYRVIVGLSCGPEVWFRDEKKNANLYSLQPESMPKIVQLIQFFSDALLEHPTYITSAAVSPQQYAHTVWLRLQGTRPTDALHLRCTPGPRVHYRSYPRHTPEPSWPVPLSTYSFRKDLCLVQSLVPLLIIVAGDRRLCPRGV